MPSTRNVFSACLLALLASVGRGQEAPVDLLLPPGGLELKPSFATCSYYYFPPGAQGSNYTVEFRRQGDEPWRRAFAPVCDKPAGIWKGSIFGLEEDADWQLRVLSADGRTTVAQGEFRTWSSHPPIAKVVDLSKLDAARSGGLVITDVGRPDGWIKYTAPPGWVLRHDHDLGDSNLAAITFRKAQHVILENVSITGGWHHAVMVDESAAVRIVNCDISGWGRLGVQQFTNTGTRGRYLDARGGIINRDAGIEISRSWGTVVERCYVHDPRHRSNSWMFSHPSGPCGIHVNYTRGGTVLRWNDIIGSDEHRWNDVIESTHNSSPVGGFYRDSDITGNYLAFGNDDGIELEGGGMNVRFYGNKVEGTHCGVSTGAGLLGPQFIIGNLVANPGDEGGLTGALFKNSHGVPQSGKRFFINNTLYGLDCTAYGGYGKPEPGAQIGYMRNNVFVCNDSQPPGEWGRRENFDHDLFWANDNLADSRKFLGRFQQIGQEEHGIAADPRLLGPAQGDFRLSAESVARGRAAAVPTICPAGADLGAYYDGVEEVPVRPLALTARPRQLNFGGPNDASTREVLLTLPSAAAAPLTFQIRQNRVFGWFKVEPAAGILQPGATLILRVTVDRARLKGRPVFRGAFLVRTPAGLARPVTVYAQPEFQEEMRPPEAPNTVYLNAADMAGAANLPRSAAAGQPGGSCVTLRGPSDSLHAGFMLPKSGRYVLLARMSIGEGMNNRREFVLTMDQAQPGKVTVNDDYQWKASDRRFRVVFLDALGELAAGRHALRLQASSASTKINELIVTDNPGVFFIQHWQRERAD